MKIACWNVRGLSKPLKQKNAQEVLKKLNFSILGLLEVKIKPNLLDRMMDTKFPGMSFLHNFHLCDNSRILIMWDPMMVHLDLLDMTDQIIHVTVSCLHTHRIFQASFVYGWNSMVARRPLWDFLLRRGDAIDLPWIMMGDFNCVRHPYEKMGGFSVAPREMADLRNCIARLELSDANHVGCYFTWFSLAVTSKLDRVMVNHHWTESNLDVFVDFVTPGCFPDHSCSVITIFKDHSRRASPFKFFNMWATHQDIQLIVRDNCHISSRAKNANEEIVEAQNRALNGDGVDNSIVELRRKAEFLLEAERLFLSQKSKCEYLKHSDRCLKFFHGMIKRNIKRNKIVALTLRDGSISVNSNEIAEDFVGFYRNLLGVATDTEALDESIIPLGPSLPDSSWGEMRRMVSVDEIRGALANIEDDKAPGPDGFGAAFFKKAWGTVGGDIIAAVMEFFSNGSFIPGSSIVENIHLAQEMLKHYARKRGSPRCILKIDLQKSYDTVHWEFLRDALRLLNFPPLFVSWIMECVSTTSFSISFGGQLYGFFKGVRGLRQGDPLSPFLFAICMEMLSRSLLQASGLPDFQFHPRCEALSITHLVYADDLLILAKGETQSVKILLDCVDKFGKTAGLRANALKSNIFLVAVKEPVRREIIRMSGYQEGSFPFCYLEIPLTAWRLTERDFSGLVDTIARKVDAWPRHTLSYAGKLELLRSVVQGVECFWLSVLTILCGVIDKIEKICRSFMWTSKHPPTSWRKVCSPINDGGLGLRDLRIWNKTLLAKTLWEIHNKKDSLWVKWINHYYWDNVKDWTARKDDTNLIKKLVDIRDELALKFGDWEGPAAQLEIWFGKKDGLVQLYHSFFLGQGRWPWKPFVWRPYILPKHRVVFWLVANGKCLTKDRQPYISDKTCAFCGSFNENAQHLFFECTVSRQIWARLWNWLGTQYQVSTLTGLLRYLRRSSCLLASIPSLDLSGYMYGYWVGMATLYGLDVILNTLMIH
ncbi:uncharacterized protein [Henckelia pumila]|uniref:uncharacterized protein n=1 Tax=Henckelia pumila TaxID=405737 RepID=UPI003C6E9BFB